MIIGTHLLIADIIYKHILEKMNIKLHKTSFFYGNIIPDLDKNYIGCPHTLTESIDIIDSYANELTKINFSDKEFSMRLGVVCHFVIDYFCLYHGKRYWKKDRLGHGVYEVNLHMKLLELLKNGCIKLSYKHVHINGIKDGIMRLQNQYYSKRKGFITDIAYALIATASICEYMISLSKDYHAI